MILSYLLLCGLIVLLDINSRTVPHIITLSGCLLGIYFNAQYPLGLHKSVEGMLIGWFVLFLAGMCGFLIAKSKPGLGGGDLMFLAMIGAFWGAKIVLLTFLIAPIIASIWSMKYHRTGTPYTVFLFTGSLISTWFI